MGTLFQDVRHALRQLRKAPGFAFVCILTLALGIGANTAIFTLVDAVMLKSLPVKNPKELYRLGDTFDCCVNGSARYGSWSVYSYDMYKLFRDHTPEFLDMAAFQTFVPDFSVRRSGHNTAAQVFAGQFVSGNYFRTFGIDAFAGRMFSPADDQTGAAPVAVISYRAWQHQFALDPAVIGTTIMVNQIPFTVAGIAQPGFFGETMRSNPPDFWMPLATEPSVDRANPFFTGFKDHALLNERYQWLYVIGRLRPDAQPARIQAEVTLELQQWLGQQSNLTDKDRSTLGAEHIVLVPAGTGVRSMENQYKPVLRFLLAIAGIVLLIACANIATLLLARGASASSVMAIRVALGAQRSRLIRTVLTESILLALMGGGAALFVAFAGSRAIILLAFHGAHFVPINSSPSPYVLSFAFVLSLITGIVFGVAPAWITSHADPAEALRAVGRATRDRSLSQKVLVVLQISLSCVLLIGAGLLTQTLRNLENQNLGFETQQRLIVKIDPILSGYRTENLYGLYQRLQERLPSMPGVLDASYSLYGPMSNNVWINDIFIEGHSPTEDFNAAFNRIGPRYFETIGTSLLRGRAIDEKDTPKSRQVAVITESFARDYLPNENPIGKHFGLGDVSHSGDFEIVGIVQDAKYSNSHTAPQPMFFLPFLQRIEDPKLSLLTASHYVGAIELRVAGKPENIGSTVRRTLAEVDPNLTVTDVVSMKEEVGLKFNQETLIARLTELFGALALILACVGLYGVTAYSVARRTSEIGIRMALGADRRNVLKLVLRGALTQLGIGLAIGIPVALASSRLIANQLYGVKTYDPLILSLAVFALTACALLAGFMPARRAASIEPVEALRTE